MDLQRPGTNITGRFSENQYHRERSRTLLKACAEGDCDRIFSLFEAGVDIRYKDENDLTALHHASLSGSLHAIRELLAYGAEVDAQSYELGTPMCLAALRGNTDAIALLLEFRADIRGSGRGVGTPLHCASWNGSLDSVKILLGHGANPTWEYKVQLELLRYGAALGSSSAEGLPRSFSAGYHRVLECQPMVIAAERGHLPLVQAFLGAHYPPNSAHRIWWTATSKPTPYSHYTSELCYEGCTALMSASWNGHEAIIAELLTAGANVNIQDSAGRSALSVAEQAGHVGCWNMLAKAVIREMESAPYDRRRIVSKTKGDAAEVAVEQARQNPMRNTGETSDPFQGATRSVRTRALDTVERPITTFAHDVRQPRHRGGFQIAVVCALEEERDAVLGLMNRYKSTDYRVAHGDRNQYSYGELGGKPIVLARLQRMGPNESGWTAKDISYSFHNIVLALVVGIAAGAPFKYDVRKQAQTDNETMLKLAKLAGIDSEQDPETAAQLQPTGLKLGDVIVSTQVTEWDFGRWYDDRLERKTPRENTLSGTPRSVSNFLNNMSRLTIRDELLPKLREDVSSNMDLEIQYKQRPQATDNVYAANTRHKHYHGCETCDKCVEWYHSPCDIALKSPCEQLGCTPLYVNEHKPSDENIFFGRVASGKTTLKSARTRNQLIAEGNYIGFEMEGLGVWEVLPTIVVKGIVDYADSHKSKQWREHPATRAALCASALISLFQLPDLPT